MGDRKGGKKQFQSRQSTQHKLKAVGNAERFLNRYKKIFMLYNKHRIPAINRLAYENNEFLET